jgi:hypothetical protein
MTQIFYSLISNLIVLKVEFFEYLCKIIKMNLWKIKRIFIQGCFEVIKIKGEITPAWDIPVFILLCYFVIYHSDIVFLHLQFDCFEGRVLWVSIWNNKNEFDKNEKNIYFTMLFCNALLTYCIPWSPIWL